MGSAGPALCAPLLMSVLVALTAPSAARRLPPRTSAWVLASAAVVAAGAWVTILAMIGSTLIGQIPEVAEEGRWSPRVLATDSPFDRPVTALCALTAIVCFVALSRASWRHGKVMIDAWRECRDLPASGDLAVLDDPVPAAFALPGAPGRIVVSAGMLRALSTGERRALLAHERAHLRHRHHLFLLLLQLAAAVDPLLRPLAREGAYALERWADEEAVKAVGDRSLVAHAIAHAALATSRVPEQALAATGGPVPQRVRALLAPPAPARHGLVVACTALMAVCCASLVVAAHDLDGLFDAAGPGHLVSRRQG